MSVRQYAPWYNSVFSLRWRLAFVCSTLFIAFVSILSIFLYNFTSDQLLRNAETAFQQRSLTLRSLLMQEVCTQSSEQTENGFVQQNTNEDIAAIYLLDATGRVIASSHADLLNKPFPYGQPALLAGASRNVREGLEFSGGPFHDGLLLSIQETERCGSLLPAPAYMAVFASYASEENTLSTIMLLICVTSITMVVAGVLIIAFATALLLKPLSQVTRATRELALGHLQQRVLVPRTTDEIGALAKSFNQMADRIEQTFAAQQASEKRARRFVSDASHELRTPITSLRGFTEVLLRGAKDDPVTTQHVLNLMKNEAVRMTKLVSDLLALARLDEGHVAEPELIDLVDLAVECLQEVRKQAPAECKLALELATHERLEIRAGRESIKQMVLILLDNAVKYGCTREEKKLQLLLDKKVGHVLLQVIDHGVGIAADDLPHIFDRFYRGQNAHVSASTPIPGTGLGLPIAQAIVQAYQGTITVCSEPDQETIFTVSFYSVD